MRRSGAHRHWLIWVATVPLAAWAIIRGFGLERGFPLDALIAYTPYVAVAALLVAGVALGLRNWAAATVAALALAWLAAGIAPRAIGSDERPRPGDLQLDVLSTNIHHGTADPDAVVGLVDRHGVDVLAVEELTPSFARELRGAGISSRLLPSPQQGASPWILPGDFNATLDHAELRRVLDLGYRDGQRGIRRLLSVDDIPGSDHRAVYARLAISAGPSGRSPPTEPTLRMPPLFDGGRKLGFGATLRKVIQRS